LNLYRFKHLKHPEKIFSARTRRWVGEFPLHDAPDYFRDSEEANHGRDEIYAIEKFDHTESEAGYPRVISTPTVEKKGPGSWRGTLDLRTS